MKYTYRLIINSESKRYSNKYKYNDGTNDVLIKINKTNICIDMNYNSKITSDSANIIKRFEIANIIYLWLYKKTIGIKQMNFYKIDKRNIITDETKLLNKDNYQFDSKQLTNSFIDDNIINKYIKMKSNSPWLIALNAYTISKTKNDFEEKFLYLWICYNTIYKEKTKEYFGKGKKYEKQSDNKSIELYLKNCTQENVSMLTEQQRTYVVANLINYLPNNLLNDLNKDDIKNDTIKEIDKYKKRTIKAFNEIKSNKDKLIKEEKINDNIYLFFMSDIGYYYRCNLFHGGIKPSILIEAKKIKKIINILIDLLEDHIKQYLYQYIIEDNNKENYYKYYESMEL